MTDKLNPYDAPTSSLAGGAADGYRPASTLVPVLVGLLFASAGSEMLSALVELLGPTLDPSHGDPYAESGYTLGATALGVLQLLLLLASAITFLVWIHRANANARALGAEGMAFSPGWCVGCWFVPFANLFKPYQAVREIYQASDPEEGSETWAASAVPPLIGAWWATYIVGAVIGQVQFRLSDVASSSMGMLSLVGGLLSVLGAYLASRIVRSIHERQEQRLARRTPAADASGRPPPPLLVSS